MNRTILLNESPRIEVTDLEYYQTILYVDIDVTNPSYGEFDMERVYFRTERWRGAYSGLCDDDCRHWNQEPAEPKDDYVFDIKILPDEVKASYRRIIEKHIEAITAQEIEDYAREMIQNQQEQL